MFHTYVATWAKKMVDIDRASFLMDKNLFAATLAEMEKERAQPSRWDVVVGAQWAWNYYCERHREKYGEPFAPNVDPDWDQGVVQPAATTRA